jgi:uncharacterized protein (TIGR02172 family)
MEKLDLKSPIGSGRTAALYGWGEGRVLKLYQPWISTREFAEFEFSRARAVCEAGVVAPQVYEIVQVDGRFGLVYERIEGRNMLDDMLKRPWTLFRDARRMAEVHAAMHSAPSENAAGLPDLHDRTADRLHRCTLLGDELKQKLLARLQALPRGKSVCHGDFHPLNILLSPRGPFVIDWMDASIGSPVADVARTLLLFECGPRSLTGVTRWILAALTGSIRKVYLRRYSELRSVNLAELRAWRPVLAGARLVENLPAEEHILIEIARQVETEPEYRTGQESAG